jgi:hypothetical protein
VKKHNAKKHKQRNPFVYGEVVTQEHFADRVEELKILERDLLDGQMIFLISPRRYGKTSLIATLFERLRRKKAIVAYVDLYRCASLSQFLNVYLNVLFKASETRLERMSRSVSDMLSSIRPKLSVTPDGAVHLELGISPIAKNLREITEEIIDLPNRMASRKKKRVVIAFDEFQEIRNFNGETMEKTLRSVIQHHRNVGYLFAGSKRHIIKDMIYRKDRAFYKAGKVIHLGKIDRKLFAKFIKKKFEAIHFKIDLDVIEEIFTITDDCPYYVQYLCHELWDNYMNTKKIKKDDITNVIKKIISGESPVYITLWNELTLHQRRLLQAIATSGGTGIFSQDFVMRNELNSTSSVQTSAHLLMDKGILDRENGEYFIEDLFFRYWILYLGVPGERS